MRMSGVSLISRASSGALTKRDGIVSTNFALPFSSRHSNALNAAALPGGGSAGVVFADSGLVHPTSAGQTSVKVPHKFRFVQKLVSLGRIKFGLE